MFFREGDWAMGDKTQKDQLELGLSQLGIFSLWFGFNLPWCTTFDFELGGGPLNPKKNIIYFWGDCK